MKYIVELKYTNPAHEHVSLRRRVESRKAIVEAANEEQAILRATRQQTALGFQIKEAVIIKPEINEQVEQLDELHQGKEYTKKELVDKMKAGNWETGYDIKPGKHVEMKHRSGKKVSVYVKEEVELDEASVNDREYASRDLMHPNMAKIMKPGDNVDFYSHDTSKISGMVTKNDGKFVHIKADPHHGGKLHMFKVQPHLPKTIKVDEAKGEPPAEFMPSDTKLPRIKVPAKPKPGVRKRGPVGSFNKKGVWNPGVREEAEINEASEKDLHAALKSMDVRHGVDADKRVAGYKMRPSVRAAQKKSDELSKVVKRPQAGTLAAIRMRKEAKGTESYPLLKPGQKLKPMKIKEGFDPEPSEIAAELVKTHGKGKVTKDHVDAYERNRDSNNAIDKEAVMKHVQKMSEEINQIEEGKHTATIAAIAAQAYDPKVGDSVRTRKGGQIPGKVEKIEGNKVYFRHPEGKLYATHSGNLRKEEVEQIDERNKQNKYKKDNVVRQIGAHAYIQGVKKNMTPSVKIVGREVMKDPKLGSKKISGLYRKLPNPLTNEESDKITEAKVNVNDPKKEKINIALNKIKARKNVNVQPTLDAEKK